MNTTTDTTIQKAIRRLERKYGKITVTCQVWYDDTYYWTIAADRFVLGAHTDLGKALAAAEADGKEAGK